MGILSNLEPQGVFKFFEEISEIPRGSGNIKQISDYLVSFAKSKNLSFKRDSSNNVIIIKEASKGYENADTLMLQSHMDMVCEKETGISKDMSKEGIDLVLDGDFISAKGTTLGADDGIGMALMLAVLDDDSLNHPRIEAVFTVDEEIGLLGAFAIDTSNLKATRMLNLDSGDETTFTVSCAGGITSKSTLPLTRLDFNGDSIKITISGLSGGHSGVMIGEGKANSNCLMARLLLMLSEETDIRLGSIYGGLKDNAITVETTAALVTADLEKCKKIISDAERIFKSEYIVTDPDLKITVSPCDYTVPMDAESTKKIIFFLNISPNGVQKMSAHIDGLVETSLNFAVLNTDENSFTSISSIRSSSEAQKSMMASRLSSLASYLGGSYETYGDYPGWEFKPKSEFRELIDEVYTPIFGKKPKTEAIHAGLECGLFSGRMPGLDCVSYGPDMWDIHSSAERLSVSSVGRVWSFLTELLKQMK